VVGARWFDGEGALVAYERPEHVEVSPGECEHGLLVCLPFIAFALVESL
jgi:hypothetical protein